ncbi:MAG: HAD family phosphatase [Saprospiraceae bacterium]|nr:HAD family phosphatase [Lewinella sp.]
MTTPSADIDTVIFDLGAVLIDWNPRYLYNKLFDEDHEMEYFLRNVCSPEWNNQQDAGRSWAEATDLLIAQHPDYRQQIRAYWERWPEMLNGPIQGTVSILKRIDAQKEHRLLALTNWSAETWPYAWEQFDFLQLFEAILVSGEEKVKKPDPRIYQLLIDKYDIVPERSIFIDDSLKNIVAAREQGILAIHFTDPEALERELERIGVLR